jgi:hypothetical protein
MKKLTFCLKIILCIISWLKNAFPESNSGIKIVFFIISFPKTGYEGTAKRGETHKDKLVKRMIWGMQTAL